MQKFPFITETLEKLKEEDDSLKLNTKGKRFAVIVDEAHSSQSGEIKTLKKVNSSMLYAVGYDANAEVLEVVFSKGSIWRYYDVPQGVYDELLTTRSVSSYMNSHVLGCYEEEPC